MRQRRWVELIKDYDLTIKANMVADALSRKTTSRPKDRIVMRKEIQHELNKLGIELIIRDKGEISRLNRMEIQPSLQDTIKSR